MYSVAELRDRCCQNCFACKASARRYRSKPLLWKSAGALKDSCFAAAVGQLLFAIRIHESGNFADVFRKLKLKNDYRRGSDEIRKGPIMTALSSFINIIFILAKFHSDLTLRSESVQSGKELER